MLAGVPAGKSAGGASCGGDRCAPEASLGTSRSAGGCAGHRVSVDNTWQPRYALRNMPGLEAVGLSPVSPRERRLHIRSLIQCLGCCRTEPSQVRDTAVPRKGPRGPHHKADHAGTQPTAGGFVLSPSAPGQPGQWVSLLPPTPRALKSRGPVSGLRPGPQGTTPTAVGTRCRPGPPWGPRRSDPRSISLGAGRSPEKGRPDHDDGCARAPGTQCAGRPKLGGAPTGEGDMADTFRVAGLERHRPRPTTGSRQRSDGEAGVGPLAASCRLYAQETLPRRLCPSPLLGRTPHQRNRRGRPGPVARYWLQVQGDAQTAKGAAQRRRGPSGAPQDEVMCLWPPCEGRGVVFPEQNGEQGLRGLRLAERSRTPVPEGGPGGSPLPSTASTSFSAAASGRSGRRTWGPGR